MKFLTCLRLSGWTALFLLGQSLFAQSTINTHRPGVYIAPYTVQPGQIQLEGGVSYQQFTLDAGDTLGGLSLPQLEIRVGILPQTELTFNTVLLNPYGSSEWGNTPPLFTLKTQFCQQKGLLPAMALRAGFSSPGLTFPRSRDILFLAPQVLVAGQWDLGKRHSFYAVAAVQTGGQTAKAQLPLQFAYEYHLTQGPTLWVEWAMRADKGGGNRLDAGSYWAFTPNMQVDVSGGYDFSPSGQGWFAELGYSVRWGKGTKAP